jgi:dihydroorotate dehydrogenase
LEAFATNLNRRPSSGRVGANLGANKDSADRVGDYVTGLTRLWGLCDYFTVNVSSPNTPGLRDLQSRSALQELTGRIVEARKRLAVARDYPIFLKVSPDLTDKDVRDIIETVHAAGLNGIIISNTTLTRPDSLVSSSGHETGGLSGAPLMSLSTAVLKRFHDANGTSDLVLIGAGGVASGADAYAKIRAGACVVQLYTALAYEGPGLIRRLKRDLAARLRADGFATVAEARGTG